MHINPQALRAAACRIDALSAFCALPAWWRKLPALAVLGLLCASGGVAHAQSSPIGFPAASVCASPATGGGAGSTPVTPGRWWNPARPGTGWDLAFAGGNASLYATWFTYTAQQRPTWYVTPVVQWPQGAGLWASPLIKYTLNNGVRDAGTVMGHMALRSIPSDPTRLALRWQLNGQTSVQDECINDFSRAATRANSTYSGTWSDLGDLSHGINWTILNPPSGSDATYLEQPYVSTYDSAGQPVWLGAQLATNAEPDNTSRTFNLFYTRSGYAGGLPVAGASCEAGGCYLPQWDMGTLTRVFVSATTALWNINLNREFATGQQVTLIRPVGGSGWVNGTKLTDSTQILVNRTSCDIAAGAATCPVSVDFGTAAGATGFVFRVNLGNGERSYAPATTPGNLRDALPPGRFQYELRSTVNAASTLLASSAVVVVRSTEPVLVNTIGTPPVSVCTDTVPGSAGAVPSSPGLWSNPQRSGTAWDLSVLHSASPSASQKLLATWYTYDAQKRPVWLYTQPGQLGTDADGTRVWWSPLLKYTWNVGAAARNAAVPVGEVSVRFVANDSTRAVVRWKWNQVSAQSFDECVQDFSRANVRGVNAAFTGPWYEPGWSGYGWQLAVSPLAAGYAEISTLTVYDTLGEPVWLQSQTSGLAAVPALNVSATRDLRYYPSPYPTGFPTTACVAGSCAQPSSAAGSLTRVFTSASAATAAIVASYSGSTGVVNQTINWRRPATGSGTVAMAKLAAVDQVVIDRSVCVLSGTQCTVRVEWAAGTDYPGARVYRRRLDVTEAPLRVPGTSSIGEHSDVHTQAGGRYRYELKAWDDANATSLAHSMDVLVRADSTVETPPAPSPDPAFPVEEAGSRVGATRGEFRVDEAGAATYSIPLMTMPGSGNMAPELALNYSSRAGAGPVGLGWQIAGQSVISRCGQTLEQGDAQSTPVRLNSGDRFCLDGQRLMLVGGTYGAQGSSYRTEVDQLTRVTVAGVMADGSPSHFTVQRKDGTTAVYGSGVAGHSARILTTAQTTVFAWPLSRVSDSAGNYMDYQYQSGAAGGIEYVLSAVHYTGNTRVGTTPYARIAFEYGLLGALEQSQAYVAGQLVRSSLRLNTIRSYGESDLLLRRYRLSYSDDAVYGSLQLSGGRSTLSSISECHSEAAEDCLSPTTFNWNTGSQSIGALAAAPLYVDGGLGKFHSAVPIDLNGDGLQDVISVHGEADDVAGLRMTLANRDSTLTGSSQPVLAACGTRIRNLGQLSVVDMRGTGFQGVVYAVGRCSNPADNGIYYHAWSSNGLTSAQRIAALPADMDGVLTQVEKAEISVMDSDGDGLSDLLVHFPGSGTLDTGGVWRPNNVSPAVWIYRNTSSVASTPGFAEVSRLRGGFDWLSSTQPGNPCTNQSQVPWFSFHVEPDRSGAFGVDGGGRTAMVARSTVYVRCFDFAPRPQDAIVVLSAEQTRGLTPDTQIFASRTRIFTIEPVAGQRRLTSYDDLTLSNENDTVIPADVNGDGLTDFITVQSASMCTRSTCGVSLQLNNGSKLNKPVSVFNLSRETAPYLRVLDYNGDGLPELLVPGSVEQSTAYWRVYANINGVFSPNGIDGPAAGDLSAGTQTLFLDRIGNGWNDQLLFRKDGNLWNVYSALGQISGSGCGTICYRNLHTISRITDGLGAWTDVEYRSLAQRSVYTRDHGGPYLNWGRGAPVYDLIAPMYVVSKASSLSPQVVLDASASSSTAFEEGTASTRYYYTGAKLQAGGRGFLGFREIASHDPHSGMLTRTRYAQQFPYIGMPQESETSWQPGAPWPQSDAQPALPPCAAGATCSNTAIVSGTVLGRSINQYNQRSTIAGLVHAYLEQSESRTYAPVMPERSGPITAQFTHRVISRNLDVDAYGNIGRVEVRTYSSELDTSALVSEQITVNSWVNNESTWHLGRLGCSEVDTRRPGTEVLPVRRSSFGYASDTGILNRETIQPGSCNNTAGFETNTIYTHNLFGLTTTTEVQARDLPTARVSRNEYDARGRFVDAQFVTLNGTELEISRTLPLHRDRYGNATRVRNGQGLESRAYFDHLGRPFYTYTPNGAWTRISHRTGAGAWCPVGTVLRENQQSADGAFTEICKDRLGREIRQVSRAFNLYLVYVDTRYDYASRPVEVSEPYYANSPAFWSRTVYDEFGRVEFVRLPDQTLQSHRYLPLATYSTNALGQTTGTVRNVLGETVSEIAADDSVTEHRYDALGRLIWTDGPLPGTVDRIQISYTLTGHKTQLIDPDKGTWRYRHNGLGELTCQIDAKNQGTHSVYDWLGRLVWRYERRGVTELQTCSGTQHGSSQWVWNNTAGTPAFGQLDWEFYDHDEPIGGTWQTGVEYDYDTLGRLSIKTTSVIGAQVSTYTERATYDQLGRPFQSFDASAGNRGVRNVYNGRGYLIGLREASGGVNGTLYWELKATDARGQATHVRMGNGTDVYARYEESTGRLLELTDSHGTHGLTQDLRMQWDAIGNLRNRQDVHPARNQTEHFEYDNRNRLRKTFSQSGSGPQELRQEQRYDASGNISFKSDVGTYTYSTSVRPHAVTQAGPNAYTYDVNGNLISDGSGRLLDYSLKDQVVRIRKGAESSEFRYFHNGQRTVHREFSGGTLTATTHYIGSVEIYQPASGSKQYRRMIGGVAIATWFETTGANQVRYLHKDHLGSITAITSESGQVVSASAFDPWGKRRDAQNWQTWAPPSPAALATMRGITPRGYTGHEHLDALGIIHMNGRIYDPNLGRFLQADILIEDTGTLNRYTYVHNNPLAYTDPTGHFSIGRLLRTVAAIAISVYTGGAAGGHWLFFGKALEGAAAFAAVVGAGALSGAISSGTIEGAAWGAFSGAVFFGIGQGLEGAGKWAQGEFAGGLSGPGFAVKTISHGLAGGTISKLQGGKFGHGFVSAAGSAATAPFLDVASGGDVWKGGVLTALVGGTLSSASGGKFANGAVTAAMSYAFNQLVSLRDIESAARDLHRAAGKIARVLSAGGHDHTVETWACNDKIMSGCNEANIFDEGLLYGPAPSMGTHFRGEVPLSSPVQNGDILYAAPVGWVRTTVDRENWSITNQTTEDHVLHHGTVMRQVIRRGHDLFIQTRGVGTGAFPQKNDFFSKVVWRDTDLAFLRRVPMNPRRGHGR